MTAINQELARDSIRWRRTLQSVATLADDLGSIGEWVAPRGTEERTAGKKEDYVLRRLIVAWKVSGQLCPPVEIEAATNRKGEPDFVLRRSDGRTLGIEVTEAGEEGWQNWRDFVERVGDPPVGKVRLKPSTDRTVAEILRAIRKKVEKYDNGAYRRPPDCDLLIYDNTSSAGFVDIRHVKALVRQPNDLLGRFRQVHLVCGEMVALDIFGAETRDELVGNEYEIDLANWVRDQVEKLTAGRLREIDVQNIIEELDALGRSERRALASHVRSLIVHLLKWQFQTKRRSKSWRLSIENARVEIHELITRMPSLRVELAKAADDQYPHARRLAADETSIERTRFPQSIPYSEDQLLDPEFYPEG